MLNAVRVAIDLSTHSLPSTFRRWTMPSSRRLSSSIDFSSRHCERGEAIQQRSAVGFLDCFAALAMTCCLALREKADHGFGEGMRLFDIGDVCGIEQCHAGAGDLAA